MTLVRLTRHKQALTLSLPNTHSASSFRNATFSSPMSSSSPVTLNSPRNIDDLEKLAVLGRGSCSTIYKVRDPLTDVVYALKVLCFDKEELTFREQAAEEAEILNRVDSPFIVGCYGIFENGFRNDGGDLSFLLEYMEAGSLEDVLRKHRVLSEQTISDIARRVLKGLHYLHTMQIVHRDIKPSNLLINLNMEIKIADFGVSRVVTGPCETSNSYMGTCAYMSPERFDPEGWTGEFSNGFAADVWALGVVLLECYVGRFPLINLGQKPD